MAEGREFGGDTMEDKAQGLRARWKPAVLHEMPKPTIAWLRGAAAGAGRPCHGLATAHGERQCALRHGLRPRGVLGRFSAAATI